MAWTLLTLAWCAFVIVLAGRLQAQPVGCFQIEGTGTLCIPGTPDIFVDTAGLSADPYSARRHRKMAGDQAPFNIRVSNHAAAAPSIIPAHQKLASDAWIDRSKNKKGERCCDSGRDCFSLNAEQVEHVKGGVVLRFDGRAVFVPGEEIMPSEDGKWWVCFWGERVRCVFSPHSGS